MLEQPNWLISPTNLLLSPFPDQQYELLFCIHDNKDASLACVEKLIKKYPHVDATIFTGGKKVGVNPKINNMYPGYANAKYDYILISDSGIRSKYRPFI